MLPPTVKTSTMILQEFTVEYGFARPEYYLVMTKIGSNENVFQYRVNVANMCEMGVGGSKKLARQNAASKVLKLLAEQGLYDASSANVQEENGREVENFIGMLDKLCTKFHLLRPQYRETSDTTSLHDRKFTYECKMGSITTEASANSKKQAKQLAAKNMLAAPKLTQQCVHKPNPMTDKRAAQRYLALYPSHVKRNRRTAHVNDFPKNLIETMAKKNIKFEDFSKQFESRNQEGLDHILNSLSVEYKIQILQESPCILTATFKSSAGVDYSFTLMAVGSSKESATITLVCDIYAILDVYMGMPCEKG